MPAFAHLNPRWRNLLARPRLALGVACLFSISALLVLAASPAAATAPLSGPQTGGCTVCHRLDPLFSHPVNFTPTRPLPLPLTDGRMTCLTCHSGTPHAVAGQAGQAGLRGAASAAGFCTQCHSGDNAQARAMHAAGIAKAHLQLPVRQPTDPTAPGQLDAQSRNCLSCHDGSIAREVTAVASGPSATPAAHAKNHPLGIPYVDRWSQWGQPSNLVPAAALDPRVRLFDNTIGCGSCHSPYSPHAKLLVMPNANSALCQSCHRI